MPTPPQPSPAGARDPSPGDARLAINAVWLGKLRWVAAIGQLATVGVVAMALGVATPVAPLLWLIGVTLISNSLFSWWAVRARVRATPGGVWVAVLGFLMLLDLVVLTAMLALTGGITNPFVVFYFVNLALSGVVLPARWAWPLSLLAIAAFTLLMYWHEPIPILQEQDRLNSLSAIWESGSDHAPVALYGSWIAFATSALVIVHFATRLTDELQTSNRLRRQAERLRARSEKLEALGTLAAGAAHELSTPLSTIAVVVAEVRRQIERSGIDLPETADDLELVRRELDRCRTILDRMATDSGQAKAGAPELLTAEQVMDETLNELPAGERVETDWTEGSRALTLHAPRTALAQALRALIQNALDATDEVDPTAPVRVRIDRLSDTLRLRIEDRGPGMPGDILERASEPFFTTKAPGSGMGLGLFLARSVVERLGGSLRLESKSGQGTSVIVVLPLAETSDRSR